MKNYDELTNDLLERRDRYVTEQKKKKKTVMGVATSLCCCLVALFGFAMWQGGMFEAAPPEHLKDDSVYAGGNETNKNDTFCGVYWVPGDSNSDAPTGNASESITFDENPSIEPTVTDDICDVLGSVIIDGVTYLQYNTDVEAYTLDICLGAASDYEGTYKTHLENIAGKLFTTKEDSDILIVKLTNGGTVALKKVKP